MKSGASARDNSPWAMVVPPGISFRARSWSTWIHCSSQVASANLLIRSCVTSIQSLAPISVPTADLISLKSPNIRMSITWSDDHFRDMVWNDEVGVRHRHDFADRDARRGLKQRRLAAGKADHRHVGDDQAHGPHR